MSYAEHHSKEKQKQATRRWRERHPDRSKESERQQSAKPGRKRNRNTRRIEVYVVYNEHDVVVYVGRTNSWTLRRSDHVQKSAWWHEASRIEHIYYKTFWDSLVGEAVLIRDHQPRYNREGVSR